MPCRRRVLLIAGIIALLAGCSSGTPATPATDGGGQVLDGGGTVTDGGAAADGGTVTDGGSVTDGGPVVDGLREEFWVVGDWVNVDIVRAIQVTPTTIYVGGDFAYVGPQTGAYAAFDATTSARTDAQVFGAVRSVLPDG